MSYTAALEVTCLLGNAPYANLTKRLEIPFLPFVGLYMGFKMREIRSSEEKTYRALATGCSNSTGIVRVESVFYYPGGNGAGDVLRLLGEPIPEQDEASVAACVKLMQTFYGFEVELLV
jgi:hypothetical protein